MPGKPPYFPFYAKDFAADSRVEAMTTEQVGAYILLLCKAWNEDPPGSLPKDDTVLARWARLSPERWAEVRAGVLAAFQCGSDDRWHQKRMREEYAKLVRFFRSRSKGGKKGAEVRWHSHSEPNGSANGKIMAPGFGFGSESSSESNGGLGERGPPTAVILAREWAFYFRGTQKSQRDLDVLDGFFQGLIDAGHAPEAILARIRAVKANGGDRDQTEESWRLRDWFVTQKPKPKHDPGFAKARAEEAERRANVARVKASALTDEERADTARKWREMRKTQGG